MIALIFGAPLVLITIILFFRSKIINIVALLTYSLLFCIASLKLTINHEVFSRYFRADSLNTLFLVVIGIVLLGVSIYSIDFLKAADISERWHRLYVILILIFTGSMAAVLLTTHLAVMWVFMEATTLSSALFIYMENTEHSLEATWKYIFLCSIGIAIAFIGIIMLSIAGSGKIPLFLDDLYNSAHQLSPFWLKLSFPIIAIGYGTKAGFAPMHTWVPDAYSEAPSPISALMSGTFANVAIIGILRVFHIMDLAGLRQFASFFLFFMGFISLLVAASYIIKTSNYKRMLAYSSIEHVGIIVIAVAAGGVGRFAALLHMTAHSLAKTSLFLTAGITYHRYRSKTIDEIRGMLASDPACAWLWFTGFALITGLPPFSLFISEYLTIKALFDLRAFLLLIIFVLLLTIILYGFARQVFTMTSGNAVKLNDDTGAIRYIPPAVMIAAAGILGIYIPDWFKTLLDAAALLL